MGCCSSKKEKGFDDSYAIEDNIRQLGSGGYAIVRKARCKPRMIDGQTVTPPPVAVKIIDCTKLHSHEIRSLTSEVEIMKSLAHVNIVRCYDFFDEMKVKARFLIVLELMTGGELFDRIAAKTTYSEAEARNVMSDLLNALSHCHSNNVMHRDLKPENLLLDSTKDNATVKLADFGFAMKIEGEHTGDICGTPDYMAPEMIMKRPYGIAADMWSTGAILYILLGGYAPFADEKQSVLFKRICKGVYEFHEQYWRNVSKEAKDLIKGLLTVDPHKRLTVQQALTHPWMRNSQETLASRSLSENLRTFRRTNAKRKIITHARVVIAANKIVRALKEKRASIAARENEIVENPMQR